MLSKFEGLIAVDELQIEGLTMPGQMGLSYDDVLLVPQRSPIRSRSEVDLSSTLTENIELSAPIVSAAMDTITEADMATAMSDIGGLGVIHRFLPLEEQAEIVNAVIRSGERTAAAVGMAEDYRDRAEAVVDAGACMIVVDVAHGHMERTISTVEDLAATFPSIPLCAGNVATADGLADLAHAGADIVKVGVGPGSHCTTREVTGFGVPQFTAVKQCAAEAPNHGISIIADGGIRKSGDAVKALLVGADAVMMGGYIGGTDESPAPVVEVDGELYKRTRGMATAAAAEDRDDKEQTIEADEGVEALSEYKGPVRPVLESFLAGMRSGLSYAGAPDIATAQENAQFMQISGGAKLRNGAHGVSFD